MFRFFPFEIGLLNLWICTVIIFALPEIINLATPHGWRRACKLPKMSLKEKAIYFVWLGINVAIYLYSVFVPIEATQSCFGPGLFIFLGGLVILGFGTHAYQTTPQDSLIKKGIYKISRNPGYFGSFCAYMGMGLMGGSGAILILAICHLAGYQFITRYEERMCQDLYPDEFPEYRQQVSKNFLFF
jgi:protein-S-isoprenylcysteine O-methyltransferase Ste14